jgi:hypothetical protein
VSLWADSWTGRPRPGYGLAATRRSRVLSMCRALYCLEHGKVISKPAAAAWASQRLDPPWPELVDQALGWRTDQRPDADSLGATWACCRRGHQSADSGLASTRRRLALADGPRPHGSPPARGVGQAGGSMSIAVTASGGHGVVAGGAGDRHQSPTATAPEVARRTAAARSTGRGPTRSGAVGHRRLSLMWLAPSWWLASVAADQRTPQKHNSKEPPGVAIPAHRQAPEATQPQQRPLHPPPMPSQPLRRLNPSPSDPRSDTASAQVGAAVPGVIPHLPEGAKRPLRYECLAPGPRTAG